MKKITRFTALATILIMDVYNVYKKLFFVIVIFAFIGCAASKVPPHHVKKIKGEKVFVLTSRSQGYWFWDTTHTVKVGDYISLDSMRKYHTMPESKKKLK